MEKGVKITSIIAGSVIFLALIIIYSIFQFMPSNTISVNGQSEIEVIPDLVTINFNIQAKADTASEAKNSVNEIYETLVEDLKKIDLSEDEIKTTNLDVRPEYEWEDGTRKELGYISNHYIKIELSTDDSEKIGEIIDAGINAEALLNYINFELSSDLEKEKKAEAIRLATEDAKIKAESMAEGLGSKLGKIVSVSDSNFGYSPYSVFEARSDLAVAEVGSLAKEATANINPSEQIVYGNVKVVYKI